MECERHNRRETGEREDVDCIVMKNRNEFQRAPGPSKLGIVVRNEFSGQVALPLDPQDRSLQFNQAATGEPVLPQPAGAKKQVEVMQGAEGVAYPCRAEPVFKERLVVG